ncbi:acyltransferase domain-containing protein [Lentzea sp. BCCO 10_0798]|uniref:Acyltransferase domain-containing protein n=1 Tax=Lentzea kristufekii TaxID=3095430 RepID=A0ABU4TZP2_9PSEU|nr:acyltransferase domain-containing protein [Lentzea sp. BCCO 10_0798]MDX8053548.1 acyltransferase domain-containing protein [Lentzea sp. BCCO 10_0798]
MSSRTVFLFPGLGAYSTGVLRQARPHHRQVDETFHEIDEVAAQRGLPPVSALLFHDRPRTIQEMLAEPAELLQLAIFGASVATHRILVDHGLEPDLLVGHSFGEMAALVAAGAFSLADGARLVCARCDALRDWEGRGVMAAIGTNETAAAHLPGVLDEPDLVIGCLNAPRQTVLTGPAAAVDRAERVARALDLPFARLQLPYASHHPSMRPAVTTFVELMADIRQKPLRRAVFSPIHLRRYTDDDDLKQALAECLVLPVLFTKTVRDLHAAGYKNFVEAGALNTLTRCVELTVPGVRTEAPLIDAERESEGLSAAANTSPPRQRTTPVAVPRGAEDAAAGVVAPAAPRQVPEQRAAEPVSREQVLRELRELYAAALEYPPDVLTEEVLLEAELGVDSLKQTSLLNRVVERFGLASSSDRMRVWELPTLGHIADYVVTRADQRVMS